MRNTGAEIAAWSSSLAYKLISNNHHGNGVTRNRQQDIRTCTIYLRNYINTKVGTSITTVILLELLDKLAIFWKVIPIFWRRCTSEFSSIKCDFSILILELSPKYRLQTQLIQLAFKFTESEVWVSLANILTTLVFKSVFVNNILNILPASETEQNIIEVKRFNPNWFG